jgi:hypothetical protein
MSFRVIIKSTRAAAESITKTVEVSKEMVWSVVTCLISLDLLTSGVPNSLLNRSLPESYFESSTSY